MREVSFILREPVLDNSFGRLCRKRKGPRCGPAIRSSQKVMLAAVDWCSQDLFVAWSVEWC